jgi:hypothetical protein
MKYLITVLALFMSGCLATPDRALPEPVRFTLNEEVSWIWKPPLAAAQKVIFAPGVYHASRRDSEGFYLVPPKGAYKVQLKGREPLDGSGGLYLPDDISKGPTIFMYDPGATTAVNGIVMMKPGSDKMFRLNAWGPSEVAAKFKR